MTGPHDPAATPREQEDLEGLAGRLDHALAQLPDLDPTARDVVDEVVGCLEELHTRGLTALVRGLRDDPRGCTVLLDLVDDPSVRMLLVMHGIVRADPTTLARRALGRVRPTLRERGGDAELVELWDRVARVRFRGACRGCSPAAATMRATVEAALTDAVPGLAGVEELPDGAEPALVPLSEVRLRPGLRPGTGRGRRDDLDPAEP